MANIIMVYASMSGNTENMALEIAEGIRESGEEVDILEAFEADGSILNDYNGILIGTYTWGNGDLPDELLDFYEEMKQLDLSGKKAAVFGSFDWLYEDGGIAVDMIRDTLKQQGAEIVQDDLKVELEPTEEERTKCRSFGKQFVKQVPSIQSA